MLKYDFEFAFIFGRCFCFMEKLKAFDKLKPRCNIHGLIFTIYFIESLCVCNILTLGTIMTKYLVQSFVNNLIIGYF